MKNMSPTISRMLAVVLTLSTLIVLWSATAQPAANRFQVVRETARTLHTRLNRYQALAESKDRLQDQLHELEEADLDAQQLLDGESPSLAAASLQEMVKKVIGQSGGLQKSAQILKVKKVGNYQKVAVRLNLSTSADNFNQLVYQIESIRPFLFLENINIRTRISPARTRGASVNEDLAKELTVTFDVFGFIEGSQS